MIVIRRAEPDDADAMVAYLSAIYAENPDTVARRDVPTAEVQRDAIEKANSAERAFFLLALDGSLVVGVLDVFAWERPEGRHCGRLGISVLSEWRDHGVGRQLVKQAIERVWQWDGFCRLELDVVAWNARAIHLYQSLGFEIEGRRRGAINLRGRHEDILAMGLVWDPVSQA
jgi:RimJ/RimL family protein N-acetyltransferase